MKKILFFDRDGTIIVEPEDHQLDSLEKLQFYPKAVKTLGKIARSFDYELVMVTNQDGLGTDSFPEEQFWPPHQKMLQALEKEGVKFREILIDRSFEHENSPTRKPRTGLVDHYRRAEFHLPSSYVIGDRLTDMELARNLGAKGIWFKSKRSGDMKKEMKKRNLENTIILITGDWNDIFKLLSKMSKKH